MARWSAIFCVLFALAFGGLAKADLLVLQDGRMFHGKITVQENSVTIVMEYGTMNFARSQVARVEIRDTPTDQLSRRLADLKNDDQAGLYDAAVWADENELPKQARELYQKVVALNPNHKAARRALGFALVEGQWRTFAQSMDLCRARLDTGPYGPLLKESLPAVEEIAGPQWSSVRELRGLAQVRNKEFAAATQTFADLVKRTTGPAALKFGALAALLGDCRDGMFVLAEPYPSDARLTGKKYLPAGPASLSNPLVLEAALHARARQELATGRSQMEEALALEPTDPDGAAAKYRQAGQTFDLADALVEKIALSHRVEIVRRRITMIRKDTVRDATDFDKQLNEIGKTDLTAAVYRQRLSQMVRHLDNVKSNLSSVLDLAGPYPVELVMEITWARQDLKKVESMRQLLMAELDANK